MFKKLKFKLMGNLINKWLAPILDLFKSKSPKVFMAVGTVATVLQFGLSAVLNLVIPGVALPADFLSLHWIVETLGLNVSQDVTSAILWFLALLTGSSTTAWLKPEKRDDKVAASKAIANQVDATRK